MHPMRSKVPRPRYRVYGYGIFHAAEMPEVRKLEDTACRLVWKTEGRKVSEDLGEDGINVKIIKHCNNKYIMKIILLYFIAIVSILTACSNTKETSLTQNDAMEYFVNNSPERGAIFYNKNRLKYQYLDQLYADSIYPALMDCNYYELKIIYTALKNTPIAEDIHILLNNSREELLTNIFYEINRNTQLEQETFLTEIIPIIKIGIDSIAHSNVEDIIDDYAGGLFNYKKLYFFTGRDQKEFQNIWNKHIDKNDYKNYIAQITSDYLTMICNIKTSYLKDITGRNVTHKINFKLPPIDFDISNEIINYVKEFTSNEKSEMTQQAIKDWIAPAAIGLLTGGIGTTIYEIGMTGYDIKVTIDDVKNNKMDANDVFICICENDICNQITNTFLDNYKNNILDEIRNIN